MIKIKFCGGTGLVTGACYLLQTPNTKVIVDCGMFQGSRFSEFSNADPFLFDPKVINAAIITHAHIDHTGRLPKLYKDGFRGKIFATAPTLDFARELLLDSEHVLKSEAEKDMIKPFFDVKDVEGALSLGNHVPYDELTKISDDISFKLQDAGHILGSAIVEVFIKTDNNKEIKVVFSGDLGNSPAPILKNTKIIKEADYVLIESVYGDRQHEAVKSRKDMLEDIIEETAMRGGVLMLPSFATERAQDLLYDLNELIENNRIPSMPVFVDSPLAIKITRIYKKYKEFYDKQATELVEAGDEIFDFPGLKFTQTVDESKQIKFAPSPKIIIAGSGMSNGGRILFHERMYLSDPNSSLLIVGYQVKGSLGRKLLDGEKTVRIFGAEVPVRAKIYHISGYSAHADQHKLLKWLDPMRLVVKKVFVIQGEEEVENIFAQLVKDKMAVNAIVPKLGDEFVLD